MKRKDQMTKHGKAAHCRSDCPFLLKSHVIQTLGGHSHCDPNDALEKHARRRRIGLMRTSFEPQSVVYHFPVSQILVPQLFTRLPCCTHPYHDAPFQRDTRDRFVFKGSDRHQHLSSLILVVWSRLRDSAQVFGTLLAVGHPH